MISQLLKFFNSIQLHYGKLNSVNERDIHLFDEKALIKLSIEHGSVEKIFESLILKYEKGVDINEEYINKVFSEYKIDIDQANSLLSKLKQPKEPSFSKKALLKTPDFSKSKFEEIAKPSFGIENKITNDKSPSFSSNDQLGSYSDDESDGLINFISFIIPLAGIIIYAVNSSQKPNMANAAGRSALLGIFFGFIGWLIYYNWLMSQINSITY